MSDEIVRLRKKLGDLAEEARTFFENAALNARAVKWIHEASWDGLTPEQQAVGGRLRHRLRQLLVALTPEIQNAPLLDKADLPRFAKLGRTMDAALRFAAFRNSRRGLDLVSDVFGEAYREVAETLDLVPKQPEAPASAAKHVYRTYRMTPTVALPSTMTPPLDGGAPTEE